MSLVLRQKSLKAEALVCTLAKVPERASWAAEPEAGGAAPFVPLEGGDSSSLSSAASMRSV